jgi:hypothetical protein
MMAAYFKPTQSNPRAVGSGNPDLRAVDSSPTRFASLSSRAIPRQSSKVGAVCVEALVRFCAGTINDDRPYRDQ